MWTNKSGSTLLRKMSKLMSEFQQEPPTDITMQYHEATTRVRDTVGKVEVILPVKRKNSQETELASVDISLLLTNLRLAGNWNNQSDEFWNEIEARKLGQVLFKKMKRKFQRMMLTALQHRQVRSQEQLQKSQECNENWKKDRT